MSDSNNRPDHLRTAITLDPFGAHFGEEPRVVDDYFGICPVCHKTDGYVNIGRNHWFICSAHKTRWPAGSNLFSAWREENEEIWGRNTELLEGYTQVEPYFHPAPPRPKTKAGAWLYVEEETDDERSFQQRLDQLIEQAQALGLRAAEPDPFSGELSKLLTRRITHEY